MQINKTAYGLTTKDAIKRLKEFGPNELQDRQLATLLENFITVFSDPMGLMLLVLSLAYWIMDKKTDSIILLIAYIPIVTVDVLLELRSQKALRELKQSLKTSCHVVRDGKTLSILTRDLVPGDVLVIEEGQLLPADGIILQAYNLTIDESSITGESIPVDKKEKEEALSGTTILTGSGLVEIQKTGQHSQIGSIAKVLQEVDSTPSPLFRTIKKVVRIVFIGSLLLAAVVFIASFLRGNGLGESLIIAFTLAMAAIPEEFPLVFTLYLSLASYRLSKKGILVKSLPAVEALGRVNVICTDKTGTLTEGKFLLEKIWEPDNRSPKETLQNVLILSCEQKAVGAIEASIFEWATNRWGSEEISKTHNSWTLIYSYPFDPKDKYTGYVWQHIETGRQILAVKGALEGVIARCNTSTLKEHIYKSASEKASSGKRLLGLAFADRTFTGNRYEDEKDLTFVGILSFTDPIRSSVREAIKELGARSVELKMLTGDHLLTAHAIADAIDLPHSHDALYTGPELEKLEIQERVSRYQKGSIFARLKPDQKLELIQTLQSQGNLVAMAGDGINDAPALKSADIGISLGERATDLARSSAQILLLKNDFGAIVNALIEGQNVLKSLAESFGYLIAFHIPIVLIALVQALFLKSQILQPIHIVLLELIVHPVSALVFSSPKEKVKSFQHSLLTPTQLFWSSMRGVVVSLLCLIIFFYPAGTTSLRSSLAVLMMVSGNIGLLLAESGGVIKNLFARPGRPLVATVILTVITFSLAYCPYLSRIFMIEKPPVSLYGLILAIGIAIGALSYKSTPEPANH